MALLASMTIPTRRARQAFGNADRGLLVDPGHVVKAALAETFGEGEIRPWRLESADGRFLSVVGWLSPRITHGAFERGCMALGAACHVDKYDPQAGDMVALAVHASPQSNVSVRDPEDGRRRTVARDVGRHGDPEQAYAEWVGRALSGPRSGVEIVGGIEIRSARAAQGVYKRHGGGLVGARVPQVRAVVPVRVVDRGTFIGFLHQGVGRLKHVGYGSIIPGSLLDAA